MNRMSCMHVYLVFIWKAGHVEPRKVRKVCGKSSGHHLQVGLVRMDEHGVIHLHPVIGLSGKHRFVYELARCFSCLPTFLYSRSLLETRHS